MNDTIHSIFREYNFLLTKLLIFFFFRIYRECIEIVVSRIPDGISGFDARLMLMEFLETWVCIDESR